MATNTKHIRDTKGNVYCAYCGKKINGEDIWNSFDDYDTYYHCDCQGAKEEIKIINQIRKIQDKLKRHQDTGTYHFVTRTQLEN